MFQRDLIFSSEATGGGTISGEVCSSGLLDQMLGKKVYSVELLDTGGVWEPVGEKPGLRLGL